VLEALWLWVRNWWHWRLCHVAGGCSYAVRQVGNFMVRQSSALKTRTKVLLTQLVVCLLWLIAESLILESDIILFDGVGIIIGKLSSASKANGVSGL